MTLSALLSALGIAPKTLPQARELIDPARATLDSVNALFTSAGLDLEPMLAAGPDALKAYLAEIDNTEELSAALLEVEQLDASLAAATTQLQAFTTIATTIGLSADASTPEAITAAFADHVAKQTTLALAKTGHPPVVAIPAAAAPATSEDHLAVYQSMPRGPERLAYFAKHEAAILAAHRAAR